MKKLLMMVAALALTLSAQAQYYSSTSQSITPFHQDKWYIGGSLTGLDLNYSGLDKLKFGFQAQGGYFVADNALLYAEGTYQTLDSSLMSASAGVGFRYYFEDNGIFAGAKVDYVHGFKSYNDLMPGVELGYSFFLSRTVTIEPALYYNQSFKKHKDYSNFGFRVGFGIYLND